MDRNLVTFSIAAILAVPLFIGAFVDFNLNSYELNYTSPEPPLKSEVTDNWVTITKDNRYFILENGDSVYPVGVSMEGAFLHYKRNLSDFEILFQQMNARGENLLRIAIEGLDVHDDTKELKDKIDNGELIFLENPPGRFNEEYVKKINGLIDLAEEYDIYVELEIGPHSCGVPNHFEIYPYHKKNGGPIEEFTQIRTEEIAKELWKQRIRFIVNEFGNTDRIFAWELWNEIDITPCGAINEEESSDWAEEMASYLRKYEFERYGKNHLISISSGIYADPYDFIISSEELDILHTHDYTRFRNNLNPVETALNAHKVTTNLLEEANYKKPYLENERSFFDRLAELEAKELGEAKLRDLEHHQEWAYLASGAAGGGAPWTVVPGPSKLFLGEHRGTQEIVRNYINLSNFNSRNLEVDNSNEEIVPMVIGDGKKVIGWLLHNNSLDYDIEDINSWKEYVVDFSPGNLKFFIKWKDLIENEPSCKEINEQEILSDLESIFEEYFGEKADEEVSWFVRNPSSYVFFGNYVDLSNEEQRALFEDVNNLFDELFEEFSLIEEECESLEKQYNGHPIVQTNFVVNNLEDKDYTIIWIDSRTGFEIKKDYFSGTNVEIESPEFSKNIAFVII